MNSDQNSLCKSALLTKLLSGKTKKMARAAIDKHLRSEKVAKHLGVDDAAIQLALDELVNQQMLTEKKGRGASSYQAADGTAEYLKTLPPFPPPPPVPARMKGFVLMGMLVAGDRWLLRKEIKGLITPTIAKTLGFSKDAVASLMSSLVLEKSVDEQDPGKSGKDDRVSYHITPHGKKELAQSEQHPLAAFKLSGEAVNQLLRAAFAGPAPRTEMSSSQETVRDEPGNSSGQSAAGVPTGGIATVKTAGEGTGGTLVRDADPTQMRVAPVRPAPRTETPAVVEPFRDVQPPPVPLSDEALLDEARVLLRDRHSRTGLVPIFELRRRVKMQFGDLAASHEELDGRLRRLRRERRVRLVSISDRSQATPEQLSESIPGEDEMFYYLGELQ